MIRRLINDPIKSYRKTKQLLGLRNTADLGLRGATQRSKLTEQFESRWNKIGSDGFIYHIFQKGNTDTFSITSLAGGDTVEVLNCWWWRRRNSNTVVEEVLVFIPESIISNSCYGNYTVTIGTGGSTQNPGGDSI